MDGSDSRFLRIKRELGFWTRTTKIILAGVIAVCVLGIVFGDYGFLRIVELKKERTQLQEDITHWKMNQRLLEARKAKLENDPFTIEKLARKRAGLYKPGETIFLFEEPESTHKAGLDRISLDNFSLNR
jgi:cell division protein FtsB